MPPYALKKFIFGGIGPVFEAVFRLGFILLMAAMFLGMCFYATSWPWRIFFAAGTVGWAFGAFLMLVDILPSHIAEAVCNAVGQVFKWLLLISMAVVFLGAAGWWLYEMFQFSPMIGTAFLFFLGIVWVLRKSEQRMIHEIDRRVEERLRSLPPR